MLGDCFQHCFTDLSFSTCFDEFRWCNKAWWIMGLVRDAAVANLSHPGSGRGVSISLHSLLRLIWRWITEAGSWENHFSPLVYVSIWWRRRVKVDLCIAMCFMYDAIARKYHGECVVLESGSAKDTERWSPFLPRPIHITPTICLTLLSLSLSFALLFPPSCSFNSPFSLSLFHQTKQRHKFSNRLQSALVALGNCILLCASFLFLCSQKLTLCPTIKGRHRGAGGHLRLQALWEMIWASSCSQCEGLIVCHGSPAMWRCLTLAHSPQLYLKFATHNMALFAVFALLILCWRTWSRVCMGLYVPWRHSAENGQGYIWSVYQLLILCNIIWTCFQRTYSENNYTIIY